MTTKPVVQHFALTHEQGLHLRPAALLARSAARFRAEVVIECHRGAANAKSVLNLLSLGLAQGDDFRIVAAGEDAEAAVQSITMVLVSSGAQCLPPPENTSTKIANIFLRP